MGITSVPQTGRIAVDATSAPGGATGSRPPVVEGGGLDPAWATGALPPPRGIPQTQLALLVFGLLALSAAALPASAWLRQGFLLTGAALFTAAAIQSLGSMLRALRLRLTRKTLARFVEGDSIPCLVTDALGEVIHANPAATAGRVRPATVAAALAGQFANPAALVWRLQAAAREKGLSREDVVTRRGHLRLSVHAMGDLTFLWRIEDLGDRGGTGRAADALSIPMLTAGPAGTILFVNEAARRLFGGRPRHLDHLFDGANPSSGRIHAVRTAGGLAHFLVVKLLNTGGRKEIYLLPADAVENSPASAAGWEAVEELPVPLLKLSSTGEILSATHEARELLPMPIGPGTRLSDLLEGLGRPVSEWVSDVAAGRSAADPQLLHGTEGYRDTILRVALHPAGPAEDRHLVAVLQDMSELKKLEAQFIQSQKMQALGQLAGGVAHDFNNLLTAISGHCDLLLLRRDEADPDFGDLMQIRQNVNRAASLVSQLLAFSRKQNRTPELLDLREVVADITHLLNRLTGERVRLFFEHEPDLRPIHADRRQIEQVLMNLVVNARDAMPDGGTIRIETENARLHQPLHRDRAMVPAGDHVVIRVIDEGVGIPPERLSKIFEPFYTTKKPGEGTGLGLSMVYGIVKQSGGFIFVDSEVGVGTVFTLWFPAHEGAPPQGRAASEPTARRAGTGRILIVEDEAPVRAFAARALRLAGHTVIEADSAEAALDLLADPDLQVDLFLTDVIMPGKDGPTWVREALASRPDTRVVFVSGYAEETFGEERERIAGAAFLSKPFSLQELTDVVQSQLG
ncbi:Signal transduction histidine kinase [Rubellimicrobium thermophilum DSM 16684]|uniref:histidine kinase n=1 Tax=Rubellimicrobium thermophilum DSM 16684 TaxID=1123069 RepID=S9R2N4_9RHOB|nr:ATP-binding protein [Rubellimicrobium thermophilum]EPX86233.1 Signal transduction histidine kinase [Rubellimicrobium thermophilum DSM 16684]